MLILKRYVNERIVINDNIVIIISSIGEVAVKLGILASKDVQILRSELLPSGRLNEILRNIEAEGV